MVVADPNAGQDTEVERSRALFTGKGSTHQQKQSSWTAWGSGGSVRPSQVHRRVPKPEAVPLDCRELGTPVSPQTAAVLLDRRGLGSPAQHARLTNVPRDTEGRGSPPRLQGGQERSSRRNGTATGEALQENRKLGDRSGPPGQQEHRNRSGPPGETEQQQERPSRKTRSSGTGVALQGNRNTGTGANTKEPKQAPTLDQRTDSQHEQTPRH
ncbi:hypothetical protein D4764_03G0011410 [Takifugu flavidus]|uniref:Uncharacterized protein n=1 Tax=Takifugu flavidus TaxID=433684 RepID=A0A5C6NAK0_9TELE|nr:hypothetical protein D4764_03G0011410 [Takifugu flavidus]